MSSVVIVTCNGLPEIEDEAESLFTELQGQTVARQKAEGLAGPNDLLQILMTSGFWLGIATALVSAYGVSIAGEAGKATWNLLAKRLSGKPKPEIEMTEEQVARFIKMIGKALDGNTVTFGPIGTNIDYAGRKPGIQVRTSDPIELATAATALAEHGDNLARIVRENSNVESFAVSCNSDCSGAIEIRGDGSLSLPVSGFDPDTGKSLDLSTTPPSAN